MRYGVLSDIHGNAIALRAAIHTLREMGVDEWICLGDIVGYGPDPEECVALVMQLGAHTVVGNHELMLSGALSPERCGELGRRTSSTTSALVSASTRGLLVSLPASVELPGLVATHAALDSPDRYVKEPLEARRQLGLLERDHPGTDLLLVGHTHYSWAFERDRGTLERDANGIVPLPRSTGPYLLNPGSVGQSRGPERRPLARCALLDVDRREVVFRATEFDMTASLRRLAARGLPYECLHQRRAPLPALRRRARRAWRRATGMAGARG